MEYEKDIKNIIKEKDRLAYMREHLGDGGLFHTPYGKFSSQARAAKDKITEAINALHEAELILRNP